MMYTAHKSIFCRFLYNNPEELETKQNLHKVTGKVSEKNNYTKTMIGDHKLKPESLMMSYGYDPKLWEDSVKPSVFFTSTFTFNSAEDGEEFFYVMSGRKEASKGDKGGLIYSRFNHPNAEIIEDRMSLLEESEDAAVLSSGMGAISSVLFGFLRPDDVILHNYPLNRSAETGYKIAQWLSQNPYKKAKIYHHDFIEDNKYQEVYKRQCSGAGSTFSFFLNIPKEQSFKLINSLSLFKSAVSLGGTESLVCHPASTTHSGIEKDLREIVGVNDGLIRLSIGLEHPEDLIADLDNAFKITFGKKLTKA